MSTGCRVNSEAFQSCPVANLCHEQSRDEMDDLQFVAARKKQLLSLTQRLGHEETPPTTRVSLSEKISVVESEIEQVERALAVEKPHYDLERLQNSCLEGQLVRSTNTDIIITCGSLAINEVERSQTADVMPKKLL